MKSPPISMTAHKGIDSKKPQLSTAVTISFGTMLHELIERIDVYHIQGTGKNRTQRLVIHYKFVGVLDFPHIPALP